MSSGTDDVLLQFFSEDFGGPAQPTTDISLYSLEPQQQTPTSPLSWDSVTPPSSPEAYLEENPQTQADAMELLPGDSLSLFDSSSSSIASPSLISQSDSDAATVSQLFGGHSGLTKQQLEAIAVAMSTPAAVPIKPDPADFDAMQTTTSFASDNFHDDMGKHGLSGEEFSSLDFEEEDLDELIDAAKAKRSRKKRKISPTESIDVLPDDINTLDQKSLLQLSSRAFEEYVKRKTANRDLTSEEKKDLKRQRRLIKNRESAQASRQRKKNYIEKLEAKVASLQQSNNQLRSQVTSLTADNTSLRQEVQNLQGLIKKTPALKELWTSGINYVASLAKQQKEEAQTAPASTHGNNVKAAGVCLLVMLFSFGLFFPQTMYNGNPALPFETATHEPVPEVVPTATRLFSSKGPSSDFTLASSGRSILSENQFNTKRLEEAYASRVARMPAASPVTEQKQPQPAASVSNTTVVAADVTDAMDIDHDGANNVELNVANHDSLLNATAVPSLSHETPSVSATQEQVRVDSEASLVAAATAAAQAVNFKPNTTYLMCNNVQQITPPASANIKDDPNEQTMISFLIPPDSLDPSHKSSEGKREILEVTCRVVGVSVLPVHGAHPSASVINASA